MNIIKSNRILLGYEISTGNPVEISPGHLIVTGITQLSGKTTTLEALIKRSGKRAIVFRTKIGEKGFSEGKEIAPFFRDRSDYEFVKSLIEAYAREKLFLEKGTLMQLCKGSNDLIEIKKRVDAKLAEGQRGLREEIYTRLQHYLENLIPQIQNVKLSKTLNIIPGINVMNLESFSEEAQSLIIQSVVDEVLKTAKDTIIVIPEAWKFIPQKYSNPCKRSIESFIRQGAANNNFIWIDSQDMAGVDKLPLKQISTWILGYQAERNEVQHTLDQIPLPKSLKPKEDEIMTLRTGQFYLSSHDGVKKVYVQPAWMTPGTAIDMAQDKVRIEDVAKSPYQVSSCEPAPGFENQELSLLRQEFSEKISDLEERVSRLVQINEDELLQRILSRLPKTQTAVYQVAPLEKLRRDFLEETKQKILTDMTKLTPEHHRIIKFVEATGKGVNQTELVSRCFFLSATSGGSRLKILNLCKDLDAVQLLRKDKNSTVYPKLKDWIKDLLQFHGATEQEIDQLYQHILAGLISLDKGYAGLSIGLQEKK